MGLRRAGRTAVRAAALLAAAVVLPLATSCGDDGGALPPSCVNDLPPACPSPPPQFEADAHPVIAARCQACHSPGGLEANRPYLTYAQIYAQRVTILNQLHACKMPPADAPPLTETERAALLGWLVCGAPND